MRKILYRRFLAII